MTRVATIIFFLSFGLAHFIPAFYIVAVIAAFVTGIAMLAGV